MIDGAFLASCAAASVVGSLHCAGMCGPLVAAVLARGTESTSPTVGLLGAYHIARGTGYAAIGAALGLAGQLVNLVGVLAGAAPIAASLAGLTLIATGLGLIAKSAGLNLVPRWQRAGAPKGQPSLLARIRGEALRLPPVARALAIGGTTAFLPCGWLYAFFVIAAGTGSALAGALVMVAFWLGTIPVLSAVGVGVGTLQRLFGPGLQIATSVALIGMGAWTLMGRTQLSAEMLATRASAAAVEAEAAGDAPLEAATSSEPACCSGVGTASSSRGE